MKIAVITAYCSDDFAYIDRCIRSVRDQSTQATHFVVADGCDVPLSNAQLAGVNILRIPIRHHDYGNTPRFVGSHLAIEKGFEAIAFLDADNWYHTDHLSSLVSLHRSTDALIGASQRIICAVDGTPIGLCLLSGTPIFADTSCMMFFRNATHFGRLWGEIPSDFHAIGDRILWKSIIDEGASQFFTARPTIGYTAKHRSFYERAGIASPPSMRTKTGIREAIRKYYIQYDIDLSIKWAIAPWSELTSEDKGAWTRGMK